MSITPLTHPPICLGGPPPGSVNVRSGKPVEGPGGRWVPCATAISGGQYVAGLFQVGQGRRQVCAVELPMHTIDDALLLAARLAATAAA